MVVSFPIVVGELVVLFLVSVPLGAVLLRGAERFLGRRVSLTVIERTLLAFYATGTVWFVLAAVPIPWFSAPLILGVLAVGFVAYLVLVTREQWTGPRRAVRFALGPTGLVLIAGTLGLLALELGPTWSLLFSNTYDGASTSLWMNLIVQNHTMPWTLAPYASWGVSYPLGAATWMSVPTLLFGWPIPRVPVLLPPLFLALTIPGAFALGGRLSEGSDLQRTRLGLLFAAFFGLVAAWPRFFLGGSYDFTFVAPLLLIVLGWIPGLLAATGRSWKDVVAVGALLGSMTALGTASTEFLIVALAAYAVAFRTELTTSLRRGLARLGVAVLIASSFVVRTILALAVWYSYPGHTLTETGSPPYTAPLSPYSFGSRLITGELDPFVLGKAKLSPFPVLSLELQLLLAVGVGLLALSYLGVRGRAGALLGQRLVRLTTVGTGVAFAMTAFLLLTTVPGSPLQTLGWLASLDESSEILFFFLTLIALIPLITGLGLLFTPDAAPTRRPQVSASAAPPVRRPESRWALPEGGFERGSVVTVAIALILAVPLGTGAVLTLAEGPNYVHQGVLLTANVTVGDAEALEWAGGNLPACSRVLIAPGSAAQFLPEYAPASIVYPMLPSPVNLTYANVVSELVHGIYGPSTRTGLLELGVTEVFGTGQNSATYPAFDLSSLGASPDFRLLYSSGDASIYEFAPGMTIADCIPG